MTEGVAFLAEGVAFLAEGVAFLAEGVAFLTEGVTFLTEGAAFLTRMIFVFALLPRGTFFLPPDPAPVLSAPPGFGSCSGVTVRDAF